MTVNSVELKGINVDEILTEALRLGHKDVYINTDEDVVFKTKDGAVVKANGYIKPDKETLRTLVESNVLDKRGQDLLYKGNYHDSIYELKSADGGVKNVRRLVIFLDGDFSLVYRFFQKRLVN